MYFQKQLVFSEEEFKTLAASYGRHTKPCTEWTIDEPEKCPCVVFYAEEEDLVRANPIVGDCVYLDDFEEYINDHFEEREITDW